MTRTPPGGWKYRQPETGWEIPDPLAGDIGDNTTKIQKHRAANPRFGMSESFEDCQRDLIVHTCARLNHDPRWCAGGPDATKKAMASPQRPGHVGNAAGGVRRVAAGIGLLIDWLGHGAKPVGHEKAVGRAKVCSDCPQNASGDWKARFTVPVAEKIGRQLQVRSDMKLNTPYDTMLNVCAACDCPLKLKVHVPFDYMASHTDETVWGRLDGRCWMLKERGV